VRSPKHPPPPETIVIDRIGTEADGVGRLADLTPVYVPFTLPGETVHARPTRARGGGWLAELDVLEASSSERSEPPCSHFGRCGGCALQHWTDHAYRQWKADLVATALRQAGFTPSDPLPFRQGLPGERRRMDFAVRRVGRRIMLGLHTARSAEVEDINTCLVLHPSLQALLPRLRDLIAGLASVRREASIIVNLLEAGPDLLLRTDVALPLEDRTVLAAFAETHDLPRISWAQTTQDPETVVLLRPPVSILSGTPVRPPPGAFLQATEAGEHAIVEAVLAGLPIKKLTNRSRIAELYAGCGTLTMALAGIARVTAYEGDQAALGALRQAVNQAALAGRVDPQLRDLVRQPVTAKELSSYAAVVLDPPHAGAPTQISQIAAARPPVVIYVSCNPVALTRDANHLRLAGYSLASVTAIDQFLWSARVESVAVFTR
jgi:23S rRNA (uracil1939-C5)-methyltransferase